MKRDSMQMHPSDIVVIQNKQRLFVIYMYFLAVRPIFPILLWCYVIFRQLYHASRRQVWEASVNNCADEWWSASAAFVL